MAIFKKKPLSEAQRERLTMKGTQLQMQGEERRKIRDFEGALSYYEQGLKIFRQTEDTLAIGRMVQGMGMIHRDLKQFKKAEKCLFEALEIFESIYDSKRQGTTYDRLGTTYYMMGDNRKSAEMYLKAGEILAECGAYEDAVLAIAAGASLEIESGKAKQAEARLRETLNMIEEQGISHEEPHVLYVLGLALVKQGRVDEAIPVFTKAILVEEPMERSAYGPAAENKLKELGASVDTKDLLIESDPQISKAMALFKDGQMQAAVSRLQELLSKFERDGQQERAAATCEALGMAQQNMGNIPEAQRFYEKALDGYRASGRQQAIGRLTMLIGILQQDQESFDL
jgi:tetratricopeptide (TPR) repeat protein